MALLGVVWLVAFALAAPPSPAASKCRRAATLYSAGYFVEAEKAYMQLLGVAPCATPKLAKQAHDMASKATKAAEPSPRAQIVLAERLQNAGFDDKARKIVQSVVESSGTARIPFKLRATNQRTAWWRARLGELAPLARSIAEAAAALLGAAVLVLLAITLTKGLRMRFARSVRLEKFVGSSDETLNPVLAAALGAALQRMRDDGANPQLNWVSGSEPKFSIPPAIVEAAPQVGWLAGLVQMLDQLLYRRMFVVTGTVLPVESNRGAGLTLTVANRRGQTIAQTTVWEKDFLLKDASDGTSAAVRYERLVVPAAVWLGYLDQLGSTNRAAPLGTRAWRSYALFALGELAHNDSATRRTLYERALDRDPRNLGARLNLAALLLRRPEHAVSVPPNQPPGNGDQVSWRERCAQAANHLSYVATHSCVASDATWYRARFLQAIQYLYSEKPDLADARLREIQSAVKIHGETKHLRDFIRTLRWPVEIMRMTAKLEARGTRPDIPSFANGWLNATAQYNLAAFWARCVKHERTAERRTECVRNALTSLQAAIERSANAADEATVDPAFDDIRAEPTFQELLAAQRQPPSEPDPPTRYAITVDPGSELLGLLEA